MPSPWPSRYPPRPRLARIVAPCSVVLCPRFAAHSPPCGGAPCQSRICGHPDAQNESPRHASSRTLGAPWPSGAARPRPDLPALQNSPPLRRHPLPPPRSPSRNLRCSSLPSLDVPEGPSSITLSTAPLPAPPASPPRNAARKGATWPSICQPTPTRRYRLSRHFVIACYRMYQGR